MITVTIPTTPKIGLELASADFMGGIMSVRMYIAGPSGDFPVVGTATCDPFNTSNSDYSQFGEILAYCGVTYTSYETFLKANTKEAIQNMILKWVREVLIPKLLAVINRYVGTQTVDMSGNYTKPSQVLEDVLKRIKFTVGVDGKVSASI